ncbi:MAG: S8 family peptidase [bacterium]|nr:S8 family peptidase [bacterium]
MAIRRILLIWLSLTSGLLAAENTRILNRAANTIATGDSTTSHSFWLYLDSTATTQDDIILTDRAQRRRAKVDPSGYLLDSRDLQISTDIINRIQATGAQIRHISRWLRAVSVEATPDQLENALRAVPVLAVDLVSQFKLIREPDPVPADKLVAPSDATAIELSYGPSLTQNRIVSAQKMHAAGFTGKGVLIAMLDTGFNTDHPAFDSTNIIATWDFIGGDADVTGADCSTDPQDRHGTGTFAAVGGYAPGSLVGTAFGADFILAKTEISCDGTEIKVEEDNWIAAAEWADSIGADIISSSLGYTVFQDSGDYSMDQLDGNTALITIAADIAASKNILVCTAGGNERGDASWPTIIFPADGDSVLAVGATRADSVIASFSSPGPSADGRIKPDIVSMGQSVFTAAAIGGYNFMSGTSLSTPLVAGGAALALESDSQLTAMQLLQLIKETGDRADNPDNDYGYGMMNAARAANILRLIVPDSVEIDSAFSTEIEISTTGRSLEARELTGFNLPVGVSVQDNGDGTGRVRFDSNSVLQRRQEIGLVATNSTFADTAMVILTYSSAISYPVAINAYPNPFTDQLTVVAGGIADTVRSIIILTAAGEKVWERVNISSALSDTITIEWDGRNLAGQSVAPGVYLVCVTTQQEVRVVKVMKVR